MDARKALRAFWSQRNKARERGIGWELTFKQWCDWWGEDIGRRGPWRDCLTMQRIKDEGPYALGNIRKGHPRDNSKTWAVMRRNREQEAAKRRWQARQIERDLTAPDPKTDDEAELAKLGYASVWTDSRFDPLAN